MKSSIVTRFTIVALFISIFVPLVTAQEEVDQTQAGPTKLAVLWISGDPDVAMKTCFMYTHAAKHYKWFEEVRLIVWGPSARLLAGDKEIQDKLKEMQESGVVVEACIACASMYGVVDRLKEMGIDVKGMGTVLTGYLKDPAWTVLSY